MMRKPLALVALACVLAACSSAPPRPAPVSERTPPPKASAPMTSAKPAPPSKSAPAAAAERAGTYVVKPGDTLYSIALEHGLDYRELAIWNGIDNPSAIRVGQELKLKAPASAAVAAPLKTPDGTVQAKPLGPGPSGPSAPAATALPPPAGAAPATGPAIVVTEPRGVRVPYSEQALAQLSKAEAAPPERVEARPPETARPETGGDTARGPDDLDWAWPARGKLVSTFNDSTSKGIAIAGKLG